MTKHCENCGVFSRVDGFSGFCLRDRSVCFINDECHFSDCWSEENTNKTNTVLKKGD